MSSKKVHGFSFGMTTTFLVASLSLACSSQSNGNGASGKGGNATGSGGQTGTGGSSSGGVTGSGGASSKGGAVGSGGSTVSGTGGSASGGGTGIGSGGSAAGGATTGKGGSASDGSVGTGGAANNGGSTGATGGGSGKGGSVGTGGSAIDAGGGAGGGGCPTPPAGPAGTTDAVAGTLITFNDNGAWCWYQDERAVVDTKNNKLVIGSVASGGSRNGAIEAVVYDIAGGSKKQFTVSTSLTGSVDDHNAPAFVVRPDGNYVAQYCGHRSDCITRFSIFDGSKWSAETKFDWAADGCPWAGASTNMVTYSNPWYMGSTIYSPVRSVGTDPAVLTSADDGKTWSYYGRLMSTKQTGYVAGYFKYWGNNTDRVDFVGTEAHPRDFDTSLYHGYIQDGKVYNSTGTVKDSSLKDTSATSSNSVDINTYTPVFKTGTTIGGVKLEHAWNHDIVRYADGTIAILGQARVSGTGSDDPDKRMLYFRFDGSAWKATYLAKAGTKLYADEQDYTGLGALVPDDPHTIYISTPYDPSTDTMKSGAKREIWRGTTCDNGATWKWTPLTTGSTVDNIRPIVPKWDANHTALLWLKGTYSSAQTFSLKVVGTITSP